MLFRSANSSFILDLRRRSMRLCAVFRAIFLPAALEVDGCFLLFPAEALAGVPAPPATPATALEAVAFLAALELVSSWGRGFICMILRERVGGGGRANWSLGGCAAEDRLRDFTVSLGCVYAILVGSVSSVGVRCGLVPATARAGSGSTKVMCNVSSCLVPSAPLMSVEDPGVGGNTVRDIMAMLQNSPQGR